MLRGINFHVNSSFAKRFSSKFSHFSTNFEGLITFVMIQRLNPFLSSKCSHFVNEWELSETFSSTIGCVKRPGGQNCALSAAFCPFSR